MTLRLRRARTAVVGLVLAGLAVAGLAGPAGAAVAAAPASQQATGLLTLFETTTFSGSTQVLSYNACGTAVLLPRLPQIGSFDNRPPFGCQLSLVNATGGRFVLCEGRGVVPAAFRTARRVMMQPGTTTPCVFWQQAAA